MKGIAIPRLRPRTARTEWSRSRLSRRHRTHPRGQGARVPPVVARAPASEPFRDAVKVRGEAEDEEGGAGAGRRGRPAQREKARFGARRLEGEDGDAPPARDGGGGESSIRGVELKGACDGSVAVSVGGERAGRVRGHSAGTGQCAHRPAKAGGSRSPATSSGRGASRDRRSFRRGTGSPRSSGTIDPDAAENCALHEVDFPVRSRGRSAQRWPRRRSSGMRSWPGILADLHAENSPGRPEARPRRRPRPTRECHRRSGHGRVAHPREEDRRRPESERVTAHG
jgi:hypothetical protein